MVSELTKFIGILINHPITEILLILVIFLVFLTRIGIPFLEKTIGFKLPDSSKKLVDIKGSKKAWRNNKPQFIISCLIFVLLLTNLYVVWDYLTEYRSGVYEGLVNCGILSASNFTVGNLTVTNLPKNSLGVT